MAEIPKSGFIKLVAPPQAKVTPSEKAALIRKGNQFFNTGNIQMAKKVFLSLRYTDGIIRLGDLYYQKSDFLEAYRMYVLAPAPEKVTYMSKRIASIIQEWLNE